MGAMGGREGGRKEGEAKANDAPATGRRINLGRTETGRRQFLAAMPRARRGAGGLQQG